MPKFKKAIRKADGGGFIPYEEGPALYSLFEGVRKDMAKDIVSPKEAAARAKRMGLAAAGPKVQPLKQLSNYASPGLASLVDAAGRPFASPGSRYGSGLSGFDLASGSIGKALTPSVGLTTSQAQQPGRQISAPQGAKKSPRQAAPIPSRGAPIPGSLDQDGEVFAKMTAANPDLMKTVALGLPGLPTSSSEGEEQELESLKKTGGASATAAIPKTKAGLKKFMQDYGKFIALGAMAGAGGKGGQIAAPIIAALPGLIEMMKGKKKSAPVTSPAKTSVPGTQVGMSSGGSVKYKSGGAIRKFKGGSMDKSKGNTKDSMLTPKYKKGGSIGEIPQHKKMAMGKPTPQSTGQKFAKGGTMKCATGGGVKGYGIAKKIRPTGPMN